MVVLSLALYNPIHKPDQIKRKGKIPPKLAREKRDWNKLVRLRVMSLPLPLRGIARN